MIWEKKIFFFLFFALDFIFQCWRQKKNGNENWNEKKKLLPSTQLGLRLSWRRAHTNSRARLSSVWPRIQFAISLCWLNVERTAKAQKFEKKFPFVRFFLVSLSRCLSVCRGEKFFSFIRLYVDGGVVWRERRTQRSNLTLWIGCVGRAHASVCEIVRKMRLKERRALSRSKNSVFRGGAMWEIRNFDGKL